jgi:hypothetical protein
MKVKTSGGTTIATYTYDPLDRLRIAVSFDPSAQAKPGTHRRILWRGATHGDAQRSIFGGHILTINS